MGRFRPHLLLSVCVLALGFLTPSPVGAEVHGGIEIGSKGVKATVLDISEEGEEIQLKVMFADTTNTSLATGISPEGKLDPTILADTLKAVAKYRDKFKEMKIDPKRTHLAVSSGVFGRVSSQKELIASLQKTIGEKIQTDLQINAIFIDVQKEAELTIQGILPKKRVQTGMVIDIGGGNTKGGCVLETGKLSTFGIPFGTTIFSELVKKNHVTDGAKLGALANEKIAGDFKKYLASINNLNDRNYIYLSGGIVWSVATFAHPADTKYFTVLTLKDVEALEAKLLANRTVHPEPNFTAIADKKAQDAAKAEWEKVKKVYNPEQMLAGLQILKVVFTELESSKNPRRFAFARHGTIGWLLAYVTNTAVNEK